jgi:hypothetical protein
VELVEILVLVLLEVLGLHLSLEIFWLLMAVVAVEFLQLLAVAEGEEQGVLL